MKDRIPTYPGRVQLLPVAGQENIYDMTMADDPKQLGDPPTKANLLKDTTAEALGLDPSTNPVVDDAFNALHSKMHPVGDTLTTIRTDLGDKWLLCNGETVMVSDYPKLAEILASDLKSCFLDTEDLWSGSSDDYAINCITYANGYWVVGGEYYDGTNKYARIAYTQSLGSTWTIKDVWGGATSSSATGNSAINCINYANGYWVVGGQYGKGGGRIAYATSPAGTWTMRGFGGGSSSYFPINCITYADGYWVMGWRYSDSVGNILYATSLDGTWTTKKLWDQSSSVLNCITYANGYWVVGGSYSASYWRIAYATSPDGTWTIKNIDVPGHIKCITHSDGYWVVGGWSNSSVYYASIAYATSLDGTWTRKDLWTNSTTYGYINDSTYADGRWVFVGPHFDSTGGSGRITYANGDGILPVITNDDCYTYIKAKEV